MGSLAQESCWSSKMRCSQIKFRLNMRNILIKCNSPPLPQEVASLLVKGSPQPVRLDWSAEVLGCLGTSQACTAKEPASLGMTPQLWAPAREAKSLLLCARSSILRKARDWWRNREPLKVRTQNGHMVEKQDSQGRKKRSRPLNTKTNQHGDHFLTWPLLFDEPLAFP